MTTAMPNSVSVSRHFEATPERVFDAWLNPQSLSRWLFAISGGDRSYTAKLDARVGGAYTITAVRADNSEWLATGEYLELDRPHRLVFSFGMPEFGPGFSRIIIDIVPEEAGCILTLTQEVVPEGQAEDIKQGWVGMFDNLEVTLG